MIPADQNVAQLLRRNAESAPNRDAFIWHGPHGLARLSYSGLWERVARISTALQALGICRDDRVIVMVPMSADLYTVLLGVLKAGAVAIFVDPWLSARTIAAIAASTAPRAFIGVPRSHLLRVLDKRLFSIDLSISTGPCLCGIPAGKSLQSLLNFPGNGAIADRRGADAALITFTSGSSGAPKGANRTHNFLIAQHQALSAVIPYRDSDIDLSTFPVFALNNLATGITTVIPDIDFKKVSRIDAAKVAAQMCEAGVVTCTASPPFIEQLSALPRSALPKLRRIVSGGAPISNEQLRAWSNAFRDCEILIAYGSTEAEPVAHVTAHERLAMGDGGRGYCMGKPISQVRARLIKITPGPVLFPPGGWAEIEVPEPGAVGELIVTGEHVCKDYFHNPEATSENKFQDDNGAIWHRMGDTGYFDQAGNFWLVGRVHSTIIRAGKCLHPQLVEQAIIRVLKPGSVAAAIGVPDRLLGEKLVVVTNAPQTERATIETALSNAGYNADDIITSFSELPLDPRHNSKVDYPRLRQMLLDYEH